LTGKQRIVIKGVKDGLVFLLDDRCGMDELLEELNDKLERSHHKLLTGPLVHVRLKLGSRRISETDKERLVAAIRRRGNLIVQSIEADPDPADQPAGTGNLHVMSGVIRSGQTVEREGHLLLLGDVNPGGTVCCTGDIFIMGALRGTAHAGCRGNADAVIAASLMRPTQLRIADCISRPPEEWMTDDAQMEFAYLEDGRMRIDKISRLNRFRQDPIVFKGV
jgi:septum site-determining protein MinC